MAPTQALGGAGCNRGFAFEAEPLKEARPMDAIVFEHVPLAELPAEWRARLAHVVNAASATVTVRIEAEDQDSAKSFADDPLFGMWRDREDMADVASYVRNIRADRFRESDPAKD
jgi:hypothetical protein